MVFYCEPKWHRNLTARVEWRSTLCGTDRRMTGMGWKTQGAPAVMARWRGS